MSQANTGDRTKFWETGKASLCWALVLHLILELDRHVGSAQPAEVCGGLILTPTPKSGLFIIVPILKYFPHCELTCHGLGIIKYFFVSSHQTVDYCA